MPQGKRTKSQKCFLLFRGITITDKKCPDKWLVYAQRRYNYKVKANSPLGYISDKLTTKLWQYKAPIFSTSFRTHRLHYIQNHINVTNRRIFTNTT
jgi:hypothetical protein